MARKATFCAKLVINGVDFKEALWVVADGADFGCFVASEEVAAVATLPDCNFVGLKDDIVIDVFEEFGVALFVGLFDVADLFKFLGDFVKAFLAGDFGEFFIHLCIFVIFAFDAEL